MTISPGTRLSHYEVLSRIGAGGMGQVYLATDTSLGRNVAIKLLLAEFTKDRDRVRRFEQEAKTVSALNHPHIITIHEIGNSDAGRFIVMELVQGQTLRSLSKPCPISLLVNLGTQIARALSAAHAAGITHRDIKPDNIMIRDDGYVKILDFGLARLARPAATDAEAKTLLHQTLPGSVLGTVAYMSPEQARGETAGPPSDIFALGIIFYELATGQHPFKAESVLGMLHSINSQAPASPGLLGGTTSEIDGLIMRMLQKQPRLRPTADEVAQALTELSGTGALSPLFDASGSVRFERHTVGRERERNELSAAFQSAQVGRGSVICIAGEAGLGKSTLVEDFLAEVLQADPGCQIARGQSSERLAGAEAYLPFLEALDNLVGTPAGHSFRESIKVIAPSWYTQLATAQDSSLDRVRAESLAVSQERMKRELAAFLQEVSRRSTLVLFFDDLHWADASTIDIIAYIATRLATMRLLIVTAYRLSEMQLNNHPFLPVKLDMQGRGLCHELPLEFLTLEDVEGYLSLEFPNHQFPKQFATLIYTKTEGSPLFMADVVRYLRDKKVIGSEGGRWALVQSVPEIETDLPETVRSMIQRKIGQLSEEDRSLLVGASVQGYEFDSTLVARALNLDPADVEERFEALERVNALVRLVNQRDFPGHVLSLRYRFVHVLYQNTLYASLRPTRRAQISAAVAEAMLELYGKHSATVASELGFLFEAARNWSSASDHYLKAARNAAEVFANQEAAELAQRGLATLRLLPEAESRARQELVLQMTLGPSLMTARGFAAPQVEQVFLRASELCLQLGDRTQLFGAQFSLAISYVVKAEYKRSREHAQQCLQLAEELGKQAMLMQSHWVLALSECYLGHLEAARDHFARTISIHDTEALDSGVSLYGGVLSRAHQARIMLYLGFPDRSRELIDEAIARAERLRHPVGLVNTYSLATQIEVQQHNPQRVEGLADSIAKHSEEHGLPYYAAIAVMMRGWAIAMRGEPETGVELLRRGLASYLATGTRQQHSYFLGLSAEALDRAGRTIEALAALAEAQNRVAETVERYYEAELHRITGEMLLNSGTGSHLGAEVCFQKALAVAREQKAKSFELRAALSLCRLWRKQGKNSEALALLGETLNWFTEGFDTPDLKDAKALLEELS
ncbi:MAG TPA: protein kinase [Blastocatellia bacterium]|nr:protein kinase [Blastocatellia bacterium]